MAPGGVSTDLLRVTADTLASNDSGQTTAEYSVVLMVITLAALAALALLAGSVIGAVARTAGLFP